MAAAPELAQQRVGDVRRDRQLDLRQQRGQLVEVDRGEVGERAAAHRQVVAGGIEQPSPEGDQQPGATIGGGRAAQPEHDVAAAEADGRGQDLARAERGRGDAVALVGGRRATAPTRSPAPPRRAAPWRRNRASIGRISGSRAAAGSVSQPPAASIASSVPFAAVGQGRQRDLVVRSSPRPAVGERPGHLHRGQRPLVRVGRRPGPARRVTGPAVST